MNFLLLDVGNTCIKLALLQKGELVRCSSLSTVRGREKDVLRRFFTSFLEKASLPAHAITACACASVVPWVDPLLAEAVQEVCGTRLLFAPRDLPVPLSTPYAPGQLGADRLVAVYAARRLYPDAPEILCVDFGTAITFDYVSGDRYLGGMICPGVESAAEGLAAHTAKLPKVTLTDAVDPVRLLGTSTLESMQFGFLQGFAAMTDGLVERIARSRGLIAGESLLVVGTGGTAPVLAPASAHLGVIQENLVLIGLGFLMEDAETGSRTE